MSRRRVAAWPRVGAVWSVMVWGCDHPGGPSGGQAILWQVAAQSASTVPALVDSVVVFGTLDGAALGFDPQTGKLRWRRFLAQAEIRNDVKTSAGLAIIPQYEVWAVDPGNGTIRWRFGGPDGAAGAHDVATAGDTLFTGSPYGWASAVDARTGQAFWSTDLVVRPFRPAVSQDLVIYGTRWSLRDSVPDPYDQGFVIALRRSDGSEAWRFPMTDSLPILGGATSGGAVWQDRVIVGDLTGRVYALRLADGALLWQAANPEQFSYGNAPAVVDDVVVLMRNDNVVEARDVTTGAALWTMPQSSLISRPVVQGSYVYVIEGPVTMTSATGEILWQFGGLDPLGRGQSFFNGAVSSAGIIYTLAVERLTGRDGTYVVALQPPVRP